MTEEEQLLWALEASLQHAPSSELGWHVRDKPRTSLPARKDKHKLKGDIEGKIQQFNTLDQFGSDFDTARNTYSTAKAICGYLTCANAILLEKYLSKTGEDLSFDKIQEYITTTMSDVDQVLPEVLKCMSSIFDQRHAFWMRHARQKPSLSALNMWVANYEISDYLKASMLCDGEHHAPAVFMRYNQWPDVDEATPDELERVKAEERFGGRITTSGGKKAVTYEENDSVYFLEVFDGHVGGEHQNSSTFLTPEEFTTLQCGSGTVLPRVAVIDLNGHFVAALACCLDGVPQLFVINTTGSDYVSGSINVAWTFDSMFCHLNDDVLTNSSTQASEVGVVCSSTAPMHVVLLGDSTLDNVVWIADPHTSISCRLQHYLSSRVHAMSQVSNYAADGFTSGDLLRGGAACISYRSRINAGDPFPAQFISDKLDFQPLSALRALFLEDRGSMPSHVVLSIGGNDIRHILSNLHTLPQVIQSLQSNYIEIVKKLQQEHPSLKLLLMFQYRPSWTQEHQNYYGVYSAIDKIPAPEGISSVHKLHSLMEKLYIPILQLAADLKLPVLDLPNSFDINNDDLYSHQIEPSSTGGDLIAHMIAEVLQNHDFSTESRLYSMCTLSSKSSVMTSAKNPHLSGENWSVKFDDDVN